MVLRGTSVCSRALLTWWIDRYERNHASNAGRSGNPHPLADQPGPRCRSACQPKRRPCAWDAGSFWRQAQGETGSRVPLAPNSFLNQDQALDALRKGQSKPLEDIEAAVGSRLGVKIIDVKLIRRGLRLIYDLTVLSKTGALRHVMVDASTGAIL